MNRPDLIICITAILISALSSLAFGDDVKPPNSLSEAGASPLKEMSEREIQEARKSFESTAKEVRRDLEFHHRIDIRREREDGTGKSFPVDASSLAEIIVLLRDATESIPSHEDYFARRDRITTLVLDSIIAEKSFPDETRLWAYELSMNPHPKGIFRWWEHNEDTVASGKYSEAKWLESSRAARRDEGSEEVPEREKQFAAELAKARGLPYLHLEAELAELKRTHDARVKRRAELRRQWELEMEGIQIADRTNQIRQQKEREKRRQQSTLASPERKATRLPQAGNAATTSTLIRWSPVAAIPILGAVYLLLRKRFLQPR